MVYEKEPPESLPVRGRSALPGGRHRRLASADLPPDAPTLVLAVPGGSGDDRIATDIASQTGAAHADIDIRIGHLHGEIGGGSPLTEVLRELAQTRRADSRESSGEDSDQGTRQEPAAVVVPLLTGSNAGMYEEVRAAVSASGAAAVVTEPLGPHPLLAEALHVRLAEAGLARADRIRQFSIGASVDGVIVVTVGGTAAVQEADITAVLLAARLAVPVVAAGLDATAGVAEAAARLREAGADRLALAPQLIGPEAGEELLSSAARQVDAGYAAPLGAHQGIVRLVNLRYEVALEELSMKKEAS